MGLSGKIEMKIKNKLEINQWIKKLPPSMPVGILLSGDRWFCVDTIIVEENEKDEIVGVATISERGEMKSGEPTIVAIYVLENYRRQGIGLNLLIQSIEYMIEKGLIPIRLDVINSQVNRLIDKLSENLKQHLQVNDMTLGGMLNGVMK